MSVVPLSVESIGPVIELLRLGEPQLSLRTPSDYWLYARLFSTTCPVMMTADGQPVGVVIAFRSQDDPDEIYVQDVMVHPRHRRTGVARALVTAIVTVAREAGCRRVFLTSEPGNRIADQTWRSLGFVNVPGEFVVDGVQICRDFKGPGKDRAVYELIVESA